MTNNPNTVRPTDNDPPLGLTRIVLIGAHVAQNRLSFRDQQWLSHTLSFCAYARLPLPPNSPFETPNLANGQDCLDLERTKLHAPVLVLANILQPRSVWDLCLYALAGHLFNAAKVSPYALSTSWPMAARAFHSQVIVAYSRAHHHNKASDETAEASAYDFIGSEYIRGPARYFRVRHRRLSWKPTLFRRDVLFSPSFAEQLVQRPQTPVRLRQILTRSLKQS